MSSVGPYIGKTPNGEAPEMLECLPDDTIDCKYCGAIVEADYWAEHLHSRHHRGNVAMHFRAEQRRSVKEYPDGERLMQLNAVELGEDNQFHCTLCNKKAYGFDMIIESHCTSDKHKRNLAWATKSSSSESNIGCEPITSAGHIGDPSPLHPLAGDDEFMRAQRLKMEDDWVVCSLCNKKFFDLDSAKAHCDSKKHRENLEWDEENCRLMDTATGQMTLEGRAFVDTNYLQIRGNTISCPLCDKQFYDIGEARVHCESKTHVKAVKWKNSDTAEQTDEPDYDAAYSKQFYRREDGQDVATVAGVISGDIDSAPCNYPNEQLNDGYLMCEVCDATPQSWGQWKEHLHSKKHLNRLEGLNEEYVCFWQKLHAGGVGYYYDHISRLWQSAEVLEDCRKLEEAVLLMSGPELTAWSIDQVLSLLRETSAEMNRSVKDSMEARQRANSQIQASGLLKVLDCAVTSWTPKQREDVLQQLCDHPPSSRTAYKLLSESLGLGERVAHFLKDGQVPTEELQGGAELVEVFMFHDVGSRVKLALGNLPKGEYERLQSIAYTAIREHGNMMLEEWGVSKQRALVNKAQRAGLLGAATALALDTAVNMAQYIPGRTRSISKLMDLIGITPPTIHRSSMKDAPSPTSSPRRSKRRGTVGLHRRHRKNSSLGMTIGVHPNVPWEVADAAAHVEESFGLRSSLSEGIEIEGWSSPSMIASRLYHAIQQLIFGEGRSRPPRKVHPSRLRQRQGLVEGPS
ncbi:hypothetical protein FOL47_007711 [Perkinsus chesapeaki]|uniref:C2H2-type domain-containing protein n=1 Tax=Perkinsus chesapeaki TaxID=330153 RepID=A0A7J6LJS9_PERCH|nr:hypothetical protein FOL47_007711 [Perkinsus chesapeaki]